LLRTHARLEGNEDAASSRSQPGLIVAPSPIDPQGVAPAELQQRIRADRAGDPYLLFRDAAGEQRILILAHQPPQLTIGRAEGCDVRLDWDVAISRLEAGVANSPPPR